MKRLLSVITIMILILFALCGCGGSDGSKGSEGDSGDAVSGESSADAYYAQMESCKEQIQAITDFKPEVVIVLGSGLGAYVDGLDVVETIPYGEIEGWPNSTAPGHAGNLVFAKYKGINIAVMQGRVHYYEGYSMPEVVLPLRVLHLLGADTCILSNAAGAINADYHVGDFVCVKDQISSFVPSPLIGENIDELGERFVGMTGVFDQEMQDTVLKVGQENNIPVHSGVYLQVTGPQFETPTEIKMYRSLGADTVAMSMAVEVIAAAHMGMKVCAINCISNMAAGMEEEGFSHDSISESVDSSVDHFSVLVNGVLDSMAEQSAKDKE